MARKLRGAGYTINVSQQTLSAFFKSSKLLSVEVEHALFRGREESSITLGTCPPLYAGLTYSNNNRHWPSPDEQGEE